VSDRPRLSAVTLHQPWASLILAGAKRFETRGWAPPKALIGRRIAVHAGLKLVRDLPAGTAAAVAAALGADWAADAPRGRLICTAALTGAWRTGEALGDGRRATAEALPGSPPLASFREDPFGDYGQGRWIWLLDDVRAIDPAPALRGLQRVWTVPAEVAALAA
jgi:hypothetical protein